MATCPGYTQTSTAMSLSLSKLMSFRPYTQGLGPAMTPMRVIHGSIVELLFILCGDGGQMYTLTMSQQPKSRRLPPVKYDVSDQLQLCDDV